MSLISTTALMLHRDNLAKCTTFEEFKIIQLEFLDFLLATKETFESVREKELNALDAYIKKQEEKLSIEEKND